MGIAAQIYDLLLESTQENPFSEEMINNFLHAKLSGPLYRADGQLSAIAHGRSASDSETLMRCAYDLRDIADDISNCRGM